MATASQQTKTREVIKNVTYKEVTLTLDEREASVLSGILGKVGGDPFGGPRAATDAIHRALNLAGVKSAPVTISDTSAEVDFLTLKPSRTLNAIYVR
jgi:hypothetical protein